MGVRSARKNHRCGEWGWGPSVVDVPERGERARMARSSVSEVRVFGEEGTGSSFQRRRTKPVSRDFRSTTQTGTGRRAPRGSRRAWHGRQARGDGRSCESPPTDGTTHRGRSPFLRRHRSRGRPRGPNTRPGRPCAPDREPGRTGRSAERPPPTLPAANFQSALDPRISDPARRARSFSRTDHAGGAAAFGALPALPFSALGAAAAVRGSDAGRVSE